MTKIVLVCGAGMSTSLMVTEMEEAAKALDGDYDISALSGSRLQGVAESADVLLSGPQITFRKNEYKQKYEPFGVIVDVIDSIDYDTMNDEKVLNSALNLLNEK